jgi:hypothetical protein
VISGKFEVAPHSATLVGQSVGASCKICLIINCSSKAVKRRHIQAIILEPCSLEVFTVGDCLISLKSGYIRIIHALGGKAIGVGDIFSIPTAKEFVTVRVFLGDNHVLEPQPWTRTGEGMHENSKLVLFPVARCRCQPVIIYCFCLQTGQHTLSQLVS